MKMLTETTRLVLVKLLTERLGAWNQSVSFENEEMLKKGFCGVVQHGAPTSALKLALFDDIASHAVGICN